MFLTTFFILLTAAFVTGTKGLIFGYTVVHVGTRSNFYGVQCTIVGLVEMLTTAYGTINGLLSFFHNFPPISLSPIILPVISIRILENHWQKAIFFHIQFL